MIKLSHQQLLGSALLLTVCQAMAIEEPKFALLSKDGAIELRQYAPFLIAETVVEGDMDEASNRGFRLIADFIFGNNQAAGESGSFGQNCHDCAGDSGARCPRAKNCHDRSGDHRRA